MAKKQQQSRLSKRQQVGGDKNNSPSGNPDTHTTTKVRTVTGKLSEKKGRGSLRVTVGGTKLSYEFWLADI